MRKQRTTYGELLKGATPVLILAVLAEAPRHGYAIARAIEQRSQQALAVGEGSLYPLLHALERDGLITSAWVTPESGPARKVYRLTAAGHTALAQRMDAWQQFSTAINRVLGGSGDESAA